MSLSLYLSASVLESGLVAVGTVVGGRSLVSVSSLISTYPTTTTACFYHHYCRRSGAGRGRHTLQEEQQTGSFYLFSGGGQEKMEEKEAFLMTLVGNLMSVMGGDETVEGDGRWEAADHPLPTTTATTCQGRKRTSWFSMGGVEGRTWALLSHELPEL